MKLTTLPIFLLLLGLMVTGFYTILGGFATSDNYNFTISNDPSANYSALVNYDEIENARESLIEETSSDKDAQFFTGTWDAIKRSLGLIRDSSENSMSAIELMAEQLKIPYDVVLFVTSVLILMVIAVIITLILKVRT